MDCRKEVTICQRGNLRLLDKAFEIKSIKKRVKLQFNILKHYKQMENQNNILSICNCSHLP